MRVVIDCRRVSAQSTGMGEYAKQLGTFLPLLRPDWDITLICNEVGRSYFSNNSKVNIYETRFSVEGHLFGDPWRHCILPVLLKKWGCQIFHDPAYLTPAFTPGIMKVVTIHDLTPLRFPQSNSWKFNSYMRLMTWLAVRSCEVILADSSFICNEILDVYHTPKRRLHVVPLGVDERFFQKVSPAEQANVFEKFAINRPFFFSNALIEPRKNLEVLLRAVAHLRSQYHVPFQVVLGGRRGWKTEEFDKVLTELQLSDIVRFTGFLDDISQRVLYQASCAYVLPSLYEGFGLPSLEALASGSRLICAKTSSLPEVAGSFADYFDPNAPLELSGLLANALASYSDEEGQRAKRITYARNWGWGHAVEAYAAVLEKEYRVFVAGKK